MECPEGFDRLSQTQLERRQKVRRIGVTGRGWVETSAQGAGELITACPISASGDAKAGLPHLDVGVSARRVRTLEGKPRLLALAKGLLSTR